ncbi:MAG: YihY/virulence factor BrkB family protein [Flavobacteriaceae bacterium]|nr:YihY/virulence factor BrkB family protein [Flavobacteriaceae bacterium]
MPSEIESKLAKIPIICSLVNLGNMIKIPGFEGLTLYNVLELYIVGIIKGALTSRAGSVSFSFFMAIFPFLLFVLNLIPYVPIEDFQADVVAFIDELLPPQTSDFFNGIIIDIMENRHGGLLSFVIILSLFLSANGVHSIFAAFENSYHVEVNRSFFKQYFSSLGVALILGIMLLITVVGIVFFELVVRLLIEQEIITDAIFWITIGKFFFYLTMIVLSVGILYYFGTAKCNRSRFFSVGLLLTSLLIIGTTYLFGVYVENFSQYNELYGSIGALLILMIYIWLNANILLLGFELNATLKKLKEGISLSQIS